MKTPSLSFVHVVPLIFPPFATSDLRMEEKKRFLQYTQGTRLEFLDIPVNRNIDQTDSRFYAGSKCFMLKSYWKILLVSE